MQTSEKIQSTIDECLGIESVYISSNGYPIFDLMINSSQKDYAPSSMIFYTENDEKLIEFQKLISLKEETDNIENVKVFLEENISNILSIKNLDKYKENTGLENAVNILNSKNNFNDLQNSTLPIKIMNLYEQTAFNCLSSRSNFNKALKRNTKEKPQFGLAYLLTKNTVLIFNQTLSPLKEIFLDKDLREKETYSKVQDMIAKLFIAKEINPQAILRGKAFNKVRENLLGLNFSTLNEYQKKNYQIIKDLIQIHPIEIKTAIETKNNKSRIIIDLNNDIVKIELPHSKNESFIMHGNNIARAHVSKSIQDILYYLNEKAEAISKNHVKIKRKKMALENNNTN